MQNTDIEPDAVPRAQCFDFLQMLPSPQPPHCCATYASAINFHDGQSALVEPAQRFTEQAFGG